VTTLSQVQHRTLLFYPKVNTIPQALTHLSPLALRQPPSPRGRGELRVEHPGNFIPFDELLVHIFILMTDQLISLFPSPFGIGVYRAEAEWRRRMAAPQVQPGEGLGDDTLVLDMVIRLWDNQ
jgi:hypothetical protein